MFNIRNILGLLSENQKTVGEPKENAVPSSFDDEYSSAKKRCNRYIHGTSDLYYSGKFEKTRTNYEDSFGIRSLLADESTSSGRSFGTMPQELQCSRKKLRTSFTKYQLERLEASFGRHKYLTVKDRAFLSSALKLSDVQIKTWYQNRRTKWKRESGHRGSHLSKWMMNRYSEDLRSGNDIRQVEQTSKDPGFAGSKCQMEDRELHESNLFEVEERFFRSVTSPKTYEVIRKWHFDAFMCAFANPIFECKP